MQRSLRALTRFGAPIGPVRIAATPKPTDDEMTVKRNAFAHHLRLKQPCANCPFRTCGAIELRPGRVASILQTLLDDDTTTFQCHKTVHSSRGGEWADGRYYPSGHEAMCAGAAAVLMKRGRPTVAMRIAFATGAATPEDWDDAKAVVI